MASGKSARRGLLMVGMGMTASGVNAGEVVEGVGEEMASSDGWRLGHVGGGEEWWWRWVMGVSAIVFLLGVRTLRQIGEVGRLEGGDEAAASEEGKVMGDLVGEIPYIKEWVRRRGWRGLVGFGGSRRGKGGRWRRSRRLRIRRGSTQEGEDRREGLACEVTARFLVGGAERSGAGAEDMDGGMHRSMGVASERLEAWGRFKSVVREVGVVMLVVWMVGVWMDVDG